MKNQITYNDLKNNPLFWYTYLCWFRGYDEVNEINIAEALEVLEIDSKELSEWENDFFARRQGDESTRYIESKFGEDLNFLIEFQEYEIVFFLNDIYIGNLGGHFEAWFFTWNELLAIQHFEYLFLLLLPITGIEEHQIEDSRLVISNHLKTIPIFHNKAQYLADCILNGLKVSGPYFEQNEVGIVNSEDHSVRNINKYPRYTQDVVKLNSLLKQLIKKHKFNRKAD